MIWGLWPSKVMLLENGDGKDLAIIPVRQGQVAVYTSIHSVSMTPLEETLVVEGSGFLAQKVRYKDQSGAGLPEQAYGGAEYYVEGDWMVIDGMDRYFESLSFRVNKSYDNELIIDNSRILLYEFFEDGLGEVTMDIVFRPRVLLLR